MKPKTPRAVTHIKVDYGCTRNCSYTVPTTPTGHSEPCSIETVLRWLDKQHEAEHAAKERA